jgi:MFS family permease
MMTHAPSSSSPTRFTVLLCAAEVFSMATFATFPALIPVLLNEWHLTNSEAGLISGMFFGGYMAAVPLLTSLTDRVDARRVYVFACVMAALGSLGFALIASGPLSALMFQALIGAGLAGTYMPGLKLLSDHIEGARRSRYVAFYTSTFGIGTSVSLLIVGVVEPVYGWRAAFMVSAFAPLVAAAIVWIALPPSKVVMHPEAPKHLLDFRPVFRNRAASGYILGYTAHCYELFGMRSWIVAFLAFSATFQAPDNPMPWSAAWIVAVISPIAIPSSIVGNEFAGRYRRRNVILAVMALSATMACVVGFLAPLPWYVVVAALTLYLVLIMGDSSALTNGVIAEASPHLRGATMAIYSFLGFGAGLVAPLVFGAVLDLAGGNTSTLAWGLAFASLGIGCAVGPIALLVTKYHRQRVPAAN